MPIVPTYESWQVFAPLYLLREADERSLDINIDAGTLELLESRGYVVRVKKNIENLEIIGITHDGRRDLNVFLDAIGLSTPIKRAAVRRAARQFGHG